MSQRRHQTESEGRRLCWHCVLLALHALEAVETHRDTNIKILAVTHLHVSALLGSTSSCSIVTPGVTKSHVNNHRLGLVTVEVEAEEVEQGPKEEAEEEETEQEENAKEEKQESEMEEDKRTEKR